MRRLLLLFILGCAGLAHATAYTASVTGNWNNSATWGGAGIPVSGDTATINNGITVTVPAGYNAVIGTSPADDTGAVALACASNSGTGILVVNGTFTFQGPIRQCTGTWTANADAALECDSAAAAVPATANYTWKIGMTSGTFAELYLAGTAGHRVILRKKAGSGQCGGTQWGGGDKNGFIRAEYAQVSNWGTSTTFLNQPRSATSGSQMDNHWDNSLIDGSGPILAYTISDLNTFRCLNTSIRTPVLSTVRSYGALTGNLFSVSPTGGDRRIEHCYIEGTVFLQNAAASSANFGFVIKNSVFAGAAASGVMPISITRNGQVTTWDLNLIFNQENTLLSYSDFPSGTLTRTILMRTGNNPHFAQFASEGPSTTVIDGWIAETNGLGGSGDTFTSHGTAALQTMTIKNGVSLPTAAGIAIGDIANIAGIMFAGSTWTVDHNTNQGDQSGTNATGVVTGENNNGIAGIYASVRNNLVYNSTNSVGWVIKWLPTDAPVNGVFANADYNSYYNMTGIRYYASDTAPLQYTITPGTHDINANPNFVDSTRNMLTWAQSVDPTVTNWTDLINRFSLMNNDSGSIPGFTILAAYTWIRAGWAPRNTALRATASDGTDIGAVAVVDSCVQKIGGSGILNCGANSIGKLETPSRGIGAGARDLHFANMWILRTRKRRNYERQATSTE